MWLSYQGFVMTEDFEVNCSLWLNQLYCAGGRDALYVADLVSYL